MNRSQRREMKIDLEKMQRDLNEHLQKKYPGVKVGINAKETPLEEIEARINESQRMADEGMTKQ